MLGNIFLRTLRDNRWGALLWGGLLGCFIFAAAEQYTEFLTGAAAERQRQIAEVTTLLQAYTFMLGELVPVDTFGGFLTARILGLIAPLLSVWAVVAAAASMRGEEELGALDVLLSTPHSRVAVLAQKAAGLALALLGATALLALGLWLGALLVGQSLEGLRVLATALNMAMIAAFWAALALLAGQVLATRRAVSVLTGGLVFASYVLTNVFEGAADLRGWAALQPFHYYAVNKPLVPGRSTDLPAWLALAGGTLLLAGLAALLFGRRDAGTVFRLWSSRRTPRPAGDRWLLGSVFARDLRAILGPALGWGLGIGSFAALIVATTNATLAPLRDALRNAPFFARLLGDLANPAAYLATNLFTYMPLLAVLFVITQVSDWAGDEEAGRLELLVAQPLRRSHILAARYAAILVGLLAVLGLFGMLLGVAAAASQIALDARRVIEATSALVPVALVVLAFGLALATGLRRPLQAVGLTTGLVVCMFFLELLAQLFDWPEWVRNLSVFHLYGRPLLDGAAWGSLLALLTAALALAAFSFARFQRRDIAK